MKMMSFGIKCDYCQLKKEIKITEIHKYNGVPCESCGCLHKNSKEQIYFTYFLVTLGIVFMPINWILLLFSKKPQVMSLKVSDDLDLKIDVKEVETK